MNILIICHWSFHFRHLSVAQKAKKSNVTAQPILLKLDKILSILKEEDINTLSKLEKKGSLELFAVTGEYLVVPRVYDESDDAPLPYIHVKNNVCPLYKCKVGNTQTA